MWPFSESKEPLPLIRCPVCDVGLVKRFVSRTAKNPGRPFYRCEYQGVPIPGREQG
uniref:GRF-type domain-containing protein n=1 Tax=Aegilops tauschii TaxID=37682 RepID=M8BGC3_AEGTA